MVPRENGSYRATALWTPEGPRISSPSAVMLGSQLEVVGEMEESFWSRCARKYEERQGNIVHYNVKQNLWLGGDLI